MPALAVVRSAQHRGQTSRLLSHQRGTRPPCVTCRRPRSAAGSDETKGERRNDRRQLDINNRLSGSSAETPLNLTSRAMRAAHPHDAAVLSSGLVYLAPIAHLDDLEQNLVGFIRAFGLLHGERTPCGEPISVSQAHALGELASTPVSQAALARRLRLDRSVVSRLADALADRGWLVREPDPDDRRAVRLVLTPAGRAAADRLAGARRAKLAALLDAIPEEERQEVIDALGTLARGLNDERTPERLDARTR